LEESTASSEMLDASLLETPSLSTREQLPQNTQRKNRHNNASSKN